MGSSKLKRGARSRWICISAVLIVAGQAAQAQSTTGEDASADPASLRFSASNSYAAEYARQPTTTHQISPADPIERPRIAPAGVYFRASGMFVDSQNESFFLDGSGQVEMDNGAGLTLAIGFKDPNIPVAYELEYGFRNFNTDNYIDPGTGLLGDNKVSMHTIAANILFDMPDIVGPVGLYAGLGIGFRISDFEFSSSGGSSSTEINGDGFFWQAMTGVTYSVNQSFQIYGGIRWTDGGTLEDEALRFDTEALNIELGVRIYF